MNKKNDRLFLGRKISVIFFLLFTCLTQSWAEAIDETEARHRAQAFLVERGVKQSLASASHQKARIRKANGEKLNACNYYIFNVGENQGFVIVSGDDRTAEILGYADRGSFDEATISPEMRAWLQGYSDQIEWIAEHSTQTAATSAQGKVRKSLATVRAAIKPLIKTRWDQDAPYNLYCPEFPNENSVNNHAATGCVATSIAQMMYYHKYPTDPTTAIPAYTSKSTIGGVTNTAELAELPSTTFDWDNMLTTYTKNSPQAAQEAVCKLMQYCGHAVQMQYDLAERGGSSAFSDIIPYVLTNYFGYDKGTRFVQRAYYSYQEWIDLIYSELADGRPVIYDGHSCGGGHSFICDGYDVDDYFHINWGWGGSDDGYFRLSVLSPYEQGTGGSSTLDGFSFGQDAIIGIQQPVPGSNCKGYCMCLSDLRFGSDADKEKAFKTIDRNAETKAFQQSLYFRVSSVLYASNSFQYGVQLVDGNGNVVASLFDNTATIANRRSKSHTFDASIPSTVPDGTYYIKVVSRFSGKTDWQDCFLGDRCQLTVSISDDVMTIQVPIPDTQNPTCNSITVRGNKTIGSEQEVIVSLKGGETDFHDYLYLKAGGVNMMGKYVDIPADQTVEARFTYVPSTSGENVLEIVYGNTTLNQTTVTIQGTDATNTQEITLAAAISNMTTKGKIHGNMLRVTATITNPSADYAYSSNLYCVMRTYENAEDAVDDNISYMTKSGAIIVPANSSANYVFDFDGLERGKFYRLRFVYYQGSESKDIFFGPYEVGADGYVVHHADGTFDIVQANGSIDAGDALYMDLKGMSSFDNITFTPSTNPNCLYLLNEGTETPACFNAGLNVVCGSSAEAISLTDGHDFFSPIAFVASQVSYTRTFTLSAGGTEGWNTLMLPFDVASVTCEGMGTVDWFRSEQDTGKNFWLKTFVGDDVDEVNFDYASKLQANTPYIIAVPDDTWGIQWQMTDKPVTFSATDALIQPTAAGALSGNSYKFCGHTMAVQQTDVYALDATGSNFELQSSTQIPAFRAWFSEAHISSLNRPLLTIGSGTVNGIHAVAADSAERGSAEWFTLTGVRLSGKPQLPGIYINNGKKIIIK